MVHIYQLIERFYGENRLTDTRKGKSSCRLADLVFTTKRPRPPFSSLLSSHCRQIRSMASIRPGSPRPWVERLPTIILSIQLCQFVTLRTWRHSSATSIHKNKQTNKQKSSSQKPLAFLLQLRPGNHPSGSLFCFSFQLPLFNVETGLKHTQNHIQNILPF